MNIGIDLLFLRKKIDGRGRYAINLIEHLQKLDTKNKYFLYLPQESEKLIQITSDNFNKIVLLKGDYKFYKRIYQQNKLYRNAKKLGLDFIHILDPTLIIGSKAPLILTVHDLIEYNVPFKYDKFRIFYRKHLIPLGVKQNIDCIITVSKSTKRDIQKFWKINNISIEPIYLGLDKNFLTEYDEENKLTILSKYNLPNDYLLYVGNLEPGKNIVTLLRAFNEYKEMGGTKKLVIVGSKKWLYHDVFSTVKDLNSKNDIFFTGYVEDEDLPLIYKEAFILIYPSFYEGFGFPNLEALSQGTPVISSNVSSIPEVVGDCGILINPSNASELREAIFKYEYDKDFYNKISEKGKERSRNFTFEEMTYKTLNVYEKFKSS